MSGKLKAKVISPGEAWNDFVNSKEGHNAAAVTPEYLKPVDKNVVDAAVQNERISKLKEKATQQQGVSQPNLQQPTQEKSKAPGK
jgi:hypothetical protein